MAVLAAGAAAALTGAAYAGSAQPGAAPDVRAVCSTAAALASSISPMVASTSAHATPSDASALRGRAASLATAAPSDTLREALQNAADDLAALRVSLVSGSTDRRADIAATLRSDLVALRLACHS
ncbi:hypothetical protein N865_07640 [Intrasporangium oryzae NRRL B-24470]|uniref:Uncharacterized protein n=1 Tax=Intrasporangium oryzae NRRL B-24470 TaxID=1386089 RepID=W9G6B5_9MICO|nr:hypothetical protein N865_07640 [Intrasporangium oryzae NRRL B-24470]